MFPPFKGSTTKGPAHVGLATRAFMRALGSDLVHVPHNKTWSLSHSAGYGNGDWDGNVMKRGLSHSAGYGNGDWDGNVMKRGLSHSAGYGNGDSSLGDSDLDWGGMDWHGNGYLITAI